jgi:serine/threonine protein kinase
MNGDDHAGIESMWGNPGLPASESCPSSSILKRIGEEDFAPDVFDRLEKHIEKCPACQSILQGWADADRVPGWDSGSTEVEGAGQETRDFGQVPALPGFRMIRELGRGGEGVVHLAEEVETQRLVALKFVPGGWTVNPSGRNRWLRQVRATAQLQNENVVRLYRIEETSYWYVMVLEFVPGGTLRDRVAKPLEPAAAAGITARLASAVEEIHRAGIWHLDLKPSNVLLDGPKDLEPERCVPKISDFGIAMRHERGTGESVHGGTPAFMAPEQAMADVESIGPAADVYGLGAILYFLLTARAPYEGSSPRELLDRVRKETIDFPESAKQAVPPELLAICSQAMARKPARRYGSPGEFAEVLTNWLESCETTGDGPGSSRGSNGRKLARVVTLSCLVLVAFWTVSKWNSPSGSNQVSVVEPLTKTEWIQELRQTSPGVFFGPRLRRLIDSSKIRTQELIERTPGNPEELASAGMLMQGLASRFVSSLHKNLYESVDDLLDCSVRLLTQSHKLDPDNQTTIRELALAEFSYGSIKLRDLESDKSSFDRMATENIGHLQRAMAWIDRLPNSRNQRHLVALVLNRARDQFNDAQVKGLESTAAIWRNFHRECESNWAELAKWEEISLRIDLFYLRDFGVPLSESTIDDEERRMLERELVMFRLQDSVFRTGPIDQDPDPAEIGAILKKGEDSLRKLGRNPDLLPSIVYEDLIRPVAAASTWFRAQGQIDRAVVLARRYRNVGQYVVELFPERYECYLALCEAHLQDWKNALKAEDPVGAEVALRKSLEEAQRATQIAPGQQAARAMLEDRESRLARFRAGD